MLRIFLAIGLVMFWATVGVAVLPWVVVGVTMSGYPQAEKFIHMAFGGLAFLTIVLTLWLGPRDVPRPDADGA